MLYNNLGQDMSARGLSKVERMSVFAAYRPKPVKPLLGSIRVMLTRQERRDQSQVAQDFDIYYNESEMAESEPYDQEPLCIDKDMPDYI